MDSGGGAAQLAFNLLQASIAAGHTASLAVGSKNTANEHVVKIDDSAATSLWPRVCTTLLPHSDRGNRLARVLGRPVSSARILCGHEDFGFRSTWHLLEKLPQPPDILHLHNLHGGYFDLRALPWLSRQVATVITLHDAWMVSGHCAHSFECDRWRLGCGHCPDLSQYPAVRRDATAYNWRRKQGIYSKSQLHVVAPSRWLMAKAKESILEMGMVSARVIPHGVDLSVFRTGDREQARSDLGLPLDAAVLLFAAKGIRNNAAKDFLTMRRAFEIVSGRYRHKSLLFIALGEAAPAERIGHGELRFVQHTRDRALLSKFYQAADLYVHAAKAEVWGLSLTEAMACGLPVVASNVGGIPDQVTEGETGFLVEVADADRFAERIGRLLDNQLLRQRMGRCAAHHAHAEFGLSKMADNYLRLYRSILAKG